MLYSIIGFGLLLQTSLLILCGDVHPNPGPTFDYNNLTICHSNIRSIKSKNKLLNIKTELMGKYDIITLSETWLTDRDKNDKFTLPGYQEPMRRDRNFGAINYGGIMAWFSEKVACKRRQDLETDDIEAMWVEVRTINKKFYLCITYRSESQTDHTYWDILQEQITEIRTNYNPKIIICGDLNADHRTKHGEHLSEFVFTNNFTLLVKEPTRITDKSATMLDQFITNCPDQVKHIGVLTPLPDCDHCLIELSLKLKTTKLKPYTRIMWNFKEANFEAYRRKLYENDWDLCFRSEDIEQICDSVISTILELAKFTIPNKIVTIRPYDKSWYTNDLRKLKKKMTKSFVTFKTKRTEINFNVFKENRTKYQSEIHKAKNAKDNADYSILENRQVEPKAWWSILKRFYKNSDLNISIPPIECDDGIITDDLKKAEEFNKYFLSASSLNDEGVDIPKLNRVFSNNLDQINITLQDVKDQLISLDCSKSYGPDGLPPILLKEGCDTISTVLHRLFTISLQMSEFPSSLKNANVIPIHKKESKSLTINYRPISILNITSKVFERVIFKYLYNYFKENFILSVFQSGFQSGKSTITQLIEVYHHFCKAVDEGKEIRVTFLDISKAFDKVWHRGLLLKLQQCGISGPLLEWFCSYLKNRKQRVVINGQASTWGKINAGVPQGSVLGPLLFLVYINDIIHAVNYSQIRLFADDTCLFIEVDNRDETTPKINSDLDSINKWSKKWLITFSPQKTKSLVISNKDDSYLNGDAIFNEHIIDVVSSHTYLGLTFSNNLKWSNHIDDISKRAR
ncbi:MAG: hypothetical protein GY707_05745, partial [Desulfobacteraceae bacterium]|nr:hypothetical protein [Desulfobacteraceae bacterium]